VPGGKKKGTAAATPPDADLVYLQVHGLASFVRYCTEGEGWNESTEVFADHDFNERIIQGVLRQRAAVELVRAREAGLEEESDPAILAYAAEHGLMVLSHDVNTMSAAAVARLHAGQPLSGLLLVPQLSPLGKVIDDLVLIWESSTPEDWAGVVDFLPFKGKTAS
jgi:hypothetical protein